MKAEILQEFNADMKKLKKRTNEINTTWPKLVETYGVEQIKKLFHFHKLFGSKSITCIDNNESDFITLRIIKKKLTLGIWPEDVLTMRPCKELHNIYNYVSTRNRELFNFFNNYGYALETLINDGDIRRCVCEELYMQKHYRLCCHIENNWLKQVPNEIVHRYIDDVKNMYINNNPYAVYKLRSIDRLNEHRLIDKINSFKKLAPLTETDKYAMKVLVHQLQEVI